MQSETSTEKSELKVVRHLNQKIKRKLRERRSQRQRRLQRQRLSQKAEEVYIEKARQHVKGKIFWDKLMKSAPYHETLEAMSKATGSKFKSWFIACFNRYMKEIDSRRHIYYATHGKERTNYHLEFLEDQIPSLIKWADKYIDSLHIDFTKYADPSKIKNQSLFFDAKEIEAIIRASTYLKVHKSIIMGYSNEKDTTTIKGNIKISALLCEDLPSLKILKLIKIKGARHLLTNKDEWKDINETIESLSLKILGKIQNDALIKCNEQENPLPFLNTCTDNQFGWSLSAARKEQDKNDAFFNQLEKDETESETESEYKPKTETDWKRIDTLLFFAHKKTIKDSKKTVKKKVCDSFKSNLKSNGADDEKINREISALKNRIQQVKSNHYLHDFLTYPVFYLIKKIPESIVKLIEPKAKVYFAAYLYNIYMEVFQGDYENMFSLLNYYAVKSPNRKVTYSLKNPSIFLKHYQPNFYYRNRVENINIITHFLAQISKTIYRNTYSDELITDLPITDIESDFIRFHFKLNTGALNNYLLAMEKIIDLDISKGTESK